MTLRTTKRRPIQPGIYWFIPETGDPVIVELVRDGSGWFLFRLGTDEMFYLTRPKEMKVLAWKQRRKFS